MSEDTFPDSKGRFGVYGGRYVAETLVPALDELDKQYKIIKTDKNFLNNFRKDLSDYVGRPSPLYFAKRWTEVLGGAGGEGEGKRGEERKAEVRHAH